MNENTSKLEAIRKEIEDCSEKEAQAIVKDAEKIAGEKIAGLEKRIFSENEENLRNITEKFKSDEKKRVSEVRFSEGRRVLLHRNKLVSEFFDRVKEKLSESLSDERYIDYLKNSLKSADKKYPVTEKTVVLCRENDLGLVNNALSGFKAEIKVSSDIKTGGIILNYTDKNYIIDLTLDAALEKERKSFAALKEMQL